MCFGKEDQPTPRLVIGVCFAARNKEGFRCEINYQLHVAETSRQRRGFFKLNENAASVFSHTPFPIKFMVPVAVTILNEMPRTPTGKPEKGKLALIPLEESG